MKTITELMAENGNIPGSLLLEGFITDGFGNIFRPFYWEEKNCRWYGLDTNNCHTFWADDCAGWRLYQEPKKKIIRWKWVSYSGNSWIESGMFYTEEEMKTYIHIRFFNTPRKLEYTATEFEE